MSLKQSVVTLSGASQNLLTALSLSSDEDVPVKALIMQPRGTNAGVIYVGKGVPTSSAYMWRLEAAISGIPPAPYILGEMEAGRFRLSEIGVLGTNGEFLHIGVIT